ncbi:hypothetical protein AVEN_70205-1 [Araneus ventricosus]|uniref:Uncharacterized protein n=1 Tax=Araneus ventricosus TaxID=182803 RepID=A0A4Y2FCF4_ARAVE|nr:hypothetical protein AVEN_70205-1 [Araneus ventricosus]
MSVNFNVSTLGSSKNVKEGFQFSPSIVQHFGCHIRHSVCDPNFEWGYIKDRVFATPFEHIDTLKVRITDAVSSVTAEMLDNTWRELEYRLDILRATKGAHIEIY